LTFNRLQDVTSQKTVVFKTTAVRALNLTVFQASVCVGKPVGFTKLQSSVLADTGADTRFRIEKGSVRVGRGVYYEAGSQINKFLALF
jgi:hypothetical protein